MAKVQKEISISFQQVKITSEEIQVKLDAAFDLLFEALLKGMSQEEAK